MLRSLREASMAERSWRKEYEAALLELDLDKLSGRVKAAENAIRSHAASLNGQASADELVEIEDALNNLSLLRRIKEE
jgi:hypothetical protein